MTWSQQKDLIDAIGSHGTELLAFSPGDCILTIEGCGVRGTFTGKNETAGTWRWTPSRAQSRDLHGLTPIYTDS